jgi:hypothetical protein
MILVQMQILLALLGATACKPLPNNGSSRVGFILGANNILPLNSQTVNEVPKSAMDAAVMIATTLENNSIKFCSGSLIDAALGGQMPRILTNHHCFAKESEAGDVLPEIRPEACEKTVIYFGFTELTHYKPTKVLCLKGSLRTDPIGDLAVLELASEPPAGITPFTLWPEDYPPEGRKAYIIHHPDVKENLYVPDGEKTPLPAASVTFDDCVTKGLYPDTEWPLDAVLQFSFKHTCDLIHGSSGSALIDRETNTILGVNWGGMKVNFAAGQQVDNVATKAGYVRAFINNGDDYRYQILADGTAARSTSGESGKSAVAGGTKSAAKGKSGKEKDFSSAMCGSVAVSIAKSNLAAHLAFVLFFLGPLFFIHFRTGFRQSNKRQGVKA